MNDQPSPPPPPGASVFSAQDRADIAQTVRQANAAGAQASREVAQAMAQINRDAAQANRQMAQAGQGGNTSVIKDPGGRIVVTGPDGKTITIDPKAGLDGDQIQEMVQTALQPARHAPEAEQFPRELIPIFGIVFPCLAAMVFFITRMFAARRTPAGSATATLPPETVARLARIEQAVEAVAIEVERISEAQRYSAQLLTDRLAAPSPTISAVAAGARVDHG